MVLRAVTRQPEVPDPMVVKPQHGRRLVSYDVVDAPPVAFAPRGGRAGRRRGARRVRRRCRAPRHDIGQRVALRYSMTGMDPAETSSYVAHHLKIAGRSDTLFSDDALGLVHQVSRGLPRAVNNLAVQSLVAAFADNKAGTLAGSAPRSTPTDPRR